MSALKCSTTVVNTTGGIAIVSGAGNSNTPKNAYLHVPTGGTTVWLHGTSTAATQSTGGFPLDGGDKLPFQLMNGEQIYGYVTTGTQTVYVLEGKRAV